MSESKAISLSHNLNGDAFMWLWAKYVRAVNDRKHCTASLRGPYSQRLSRHNRDLLTEGKVILDEVPGDEFKAIYICGVARKGYSVKKNYPFNLHAAILPREGAKDAFEFNGWELCLENGIFLPIPREAELPERYKGLAPEFTTCRIFRWAVCAVGKVPGIAFV
jgi:hypothetical protein